MENKKEVVGKRIDSMVERNANMLSAGALHAIVLCAGGLRMGCNWGFLEKSNKDFSDILEALREENKQVHAYPVGNGALVTCNEMFLAHNVNTILPKAINGNFMETAKQRRASEKDKFQKFLSNVLSGKSKYSNKENGYYDLTLGLYSINEVNTIKINNTDYPAYKLNLVEALDFAVKSANEKNMKVYVRAIDSNGKATYGDAMSLASNSKGLMAVYKALEIADSKTGVFVHMKFK